MVKSCFYVNLLLLFISNNIVAQKTSGIRENVKAAKTGDDLIDTSVTILELPGNGASTNSYGFNSFIEPADRYSFLAQYMRYAPQGTIQWNHLFSDGLFSNSTLIFSNYV
jgi:hypothetical protein